MMNCSTGSQPRWCGWNHHLECLNAALHLADTRQSHSRATKQLKETVRPSALLVTMSRYRGVARRPRGIEESRLPGVDLRVESLGAFEDVPPLLRSEADLIALDGHGWTDHHAHFGTDSNSIHFCSDYLRSQEGNGIVAPIIVFAFCAGGTAQFRDAVEASVKRPQVAFLGSTTAVKYDDAARTYPSLLAALADMGSNPDPSSAVAQLMPVRASLASMFRDLGSLA